MVVQMRAVKATDKLQLRLALRFAAARCDEMLGVSLLYTRFANAKFSRLETSFTR